MFSKEDIDLGKRQRWLGTMGSLYSVTEFFEFARRLAMKNILGQEIAIDIILHDLNERILLVDDPGRWQFYQKMVCRVPEWKWGKTYKLRDLLKRDKIVRGESKEFAFTKLMTCGLCGSGITAEEKFKTLKSTGLTVRYVYYGCSRSKDLHCKNQYIREEELIKQLIEIIGQMDVNETDIRKRFDEEMQRIGKFNKVFLGQKKAAQQEIEFDARSYATYVLNEGAPTEKRELLGMLKNKLVLAQRTITTIGK